MITNSSALYLCQYLPEQLIRESLTLLLLIAKQKLLLKVVIVHGLRALIQKQKASVVLHSILRYSAEGR